jgi:hypothetical protein
VLLEAVLLEAVLLEAVLLEAVLLEAVLLEAVLLEGLLVVARFIVTHVNLLSSLSPVAESSRALALAQSHSHEFGGEQLQTP